MDVDAYLARIYGHNFQQPDQPIAMIETRIGMKRTKDVEYILLRPHPSEFYLYYDA